MAKQRKRSFESWAAAEEMYFKVLSGAAVYQTALGQAVHGNVKWISGLQPRKIGLCRLEDANGGIVIVVEREGVTAHYLSEWLQLIQTQEAPSTKKEYMPSYKAWLDRRQLAAQAKTLQEEAAARAAQSSIGCSRLPTAPIVNQDVRQY